MGPEDIAAVTKNPIPYFKTSDIPARRLNFSGKICSRYFLPGF